MRVGLGLLTMTYFSQELTAQQGFTWEQVRDKFESSNPTLRAGEINVAESRAQEITAFLRPNPEVAATLDQVGNTVSGSIFSASNMVTSFSYLHERQGKRELRRDSAQKGTAIAESSKEDQRNALFCSTCGMRSYKPCRQKPCWRLLAKTWPITTGCYP